MEGLWTSEKRLVNAPEACKPNTKHANRPFHQPPKFPPTECSFLLIIIIIIIIINFCVFPYGLFNTQLQNY